MSQKSLAKISKENCVEFYIASEVPPLTGLVVNNPLLEYILDRRFIPWGRFILVYGPKGSSKTTLFFELAKIFQVNGGEAIWLEAENAADMDYAKSQGVDTTRLGLIKINSLEEGLNTLGCLINNYQLEDPEMKCPKLICFDSLAGIGVESEMDDKFGMENVTVGKHAKILSLFFRKYASKLAKLHMVVMFINQLRDSISTGFSPVPLPESAKEALLGGKSQYFFSTYHWRLKFITDLTQVDENGEEEEGEGKKKAVRKVGSVHALDCVRNKVGREGKGQSVVFNTYREGGVDWYTPLVTKLKKEYPGLVALKGSRYFWKGPPVEYRKFVKNEQGQYTGASEVRILGECIPVKQPDGTMAPGTEPISYSGLDLAAAIANSDGAKEVIRNLFGVPPFGAAGKIEDINVDADEAEIEDVKPEPTKKKKIKPIEIKEINIA